MANWALLAVKRGKGPQAEGCLEILDKITSSKSSFRFKDKTHFRMYLCVLQGHAALLEKNSGLAIKQSQRALNLMEGTLSVEVLSFAGYVCCWIGNHAEGYSYYQNTLNALAASLRSFTCNSAAEIERYYEMQALALYNVAVESMHQGNKPNAEMYVLKAKDIATRHLSGSWVLGKVEQLYNEVLFQEPQRQVTALKRPELREKTGIKPSDMLYSSPEYFKYYHQITADQKGKPRRNRSVEAAGVKRRGRNLRSIEAHEGRKSNAAKLGTLRRASAVMKLQRAWKRHRELKFARKIQAAWRGSKGRSLYTSLKKAECSVKEFLKESLKKVKKAAAILKVQSLSIGLFRKRCLAELKQQGLRHRTAMTIDSLVNTVQGLVDRENLKDLYFLTKLKVLVSVYNKKSLLSTLNSLTLYDASVRTITSTLKMYIQQKRYRRLREGIFLIQTHYRAHLSCRTQQIKKNFATFYNKSGVLLAQALKASLCRMTYSSSLTQLGNPGANIALDLKSEESARVLQRWFRVYIHPRICTKSAISLQRFWRGRSARRTLAAQQHAASKIQALLRMKLTRIELTKRQASARVLQSFFAKKLLMTALNPTN